MFLNYTNNISRLTEYWSVSVIKSKCFKTR